MTDQTIPADKVREIIAGMRESMRRAECDGTSPKFMGSMLVYVAALEALLPPPPRPTMADMTPEERRACKWMQADVAGHNTRYVVANPCDEDGEAALIDPDGRLDWTLPDYVTPRPDLPRLTWPGTEKPAPVPALPDGWRLADHKDNGRVIVTNTTPNSDGNIYFVLPADDPMGYDWFFCAPDALTYLDQEAEDDTPEAVPPNTLAVGSEWADGEALTRACQESGRDQITVTDCEGDVYVWGANQDDWRDLHPIQKYAPFTIIHAGKKADQ